MAGNLVDTAYVQTVHGATITDTTRCTALIGITSDIVREYCGTDWSSTTAPAQIKLVTAQLVSDAISKAPADSAAVRAEQIGDYRVEYQRTSSINIDLDPYKPVLDQYRRTAYSISVNVPFDGVPPVVET